MNPPLSPADLGVTLPQIPFRRDVTFPHGQVEEVSPLIRRIVAPNENAFSFRGTGTYIIGRGEVAVIDPGPLIESHVAAILEALKGERIARILITHTHNDHSPAAAPLKAATGAQTFGFGPHGSAHLDNGIKVEEGGDMEFSPDIVLRDGQKIVGEGWTIEAIHTPGHTSNHLCFALKEEGALFTGDHVMGWSTTVIVPPDGDMRAYMQSLESIARRNDRIIYPTHGAPIENPQEFVRLLIAHRNGREAQIVACLRHGVTQIPEMVAIIYAGVSKSLHPAAALSVLAHIQWLCDQGKVRADGVPGTGARYKLS